MGYPGLDLNGRIAVVIGGTSGIGRALARGLAQAGADVVACSRRADQGAEVATEIEGLGKRTLRVTADVGDRASLDRLLSTVVSDLGPVDILVNCAGRTKRVSTLEMTDDDWNSIIDTNLHGTLRACQVFGRHMIERRYGRIVNIASLSSFVAFQDVAAYAASKAAVASLTKSLAVEWAPLGVCVNALAPGIFRTPLNQHILDGTGRGRELLLRTPQRRFGNVDELVGGCIYLASESASFTTGEILVVDGGFLSSGANQ